MATGAAFERATGAGGLVKRPGLRQHPPMRALRALAALVLASLTPVAAAAPVTAIIFRGNAKTPKQAEKALAQWTSGEAGRAFSRFGRLSGEYPKVIRSDTVPGMRPGYLAVVLGFCPAEKAKALLSILTALDPEIYGREVDGPEGACPEFDPDRTHPGHAADLAGGDDGDEPPPRARESGREPQPAETRTAGSRTVDPRLLELRSDGMWAGRGTALAMAFLHLAPSPELVGPPSTSTRLVEFGEMVEVLEASYRRENEREWMCDGRARVRRSTGEEGWVDACRLKPREALVAAVLDTVAAGHAGTSRPARFLEAGSLVIALAGKGDEVLVVTANGDALDVPGDALTLAPEAIRAARVAARRDAVARLRDGDTPDFGTSAGRLVTVTEPVEAVAESSGSPIRIAAGALLLEVEGSEHDTKVVMPGGDAARVVSCYLTDDPGELGVAKRLERIRRLRAAGADARAHAENVKARKDFPGARLAALLRGGKAAPPACRPPPPERDPPAGQRWSSRPNGLEVLGTGAAANAPSAYDWPALATAYLPSFTTDAPLPPPLREVAANARRQELATWGGEMGPSDPARFQFVVPASVQRGRIYALDPTTRPSPWVVTGELIGFVQPVVDCDGCEVGARQYTGVVRVASAPSAMLVWLPVPASWSTWTKLLTSQVTAEGQHLSFVPAPTFSKRVVQTWTTYPMQFIEAAWTVKLTPGDRTLLLIRTLMGGCPRMHLFSVGETLEFLGEGSEDCFEGD